MKFTFCITLIFITFIQVPYATCKNIYQDSPCFVEKRVENLIQRMTLEEKAGQMYQHDGLLGAKKLIRDAKVGSFLNVLGPKRNELQKIAIEKTRLGIPLIFGIDAVHGHALWKGSTVFPTPIGIASTWNPFLVQKTASITAKEARVTGADWTFSPLCDVARDLRWGRVGETFGEDPYLVSRMVCAKINGYQGKDLRKWDTILAGPKHFIGYSETVGGRDSSSADLSQRTLREVFLPPFSAAIKAGARNIMIAYQDLGGIPCCANRQLITNLLKNKMTFEGFTVTDYDDIGLLVHKQMVAKDMQDAVRQCVSAGNDMAMATSEFTDTLVKLVKKGKLSEQIVDKAVRRILTVKFQLGLFEHPYSPVQNMNIIGCALHRKVAYMVAQESIVLIKNKGLLPLDKNIQSIAVIGPNANNPISQLGDWTGPQPRQNILTVLDGIVNKACSKTNVYYAQGSQLTEFSPIPKQFLSTPDKKHHELYRDLIDEAIKLASKADIAVVVLGDSPILNGEKHARSDLDLPKPQQRLIKAIYNTGTPTVVVLINAKPLAINWIVENIPAIVEAWNPGVEGGSAIADVLFGDYNPGGKLPITFPHSVGELPSYYNYKPGWHAESYMFTTGKPLFPFGHGLSYTKFKYSNFSITPQKVTREHFAVHIGVNVKNIGRVSGDEVVQLYVNDVVSSVITPLQELKGFKRITLNPGEEKLVEFTLTKEQLSLIARDMKKTLEPGEFEVMVGSSSQDIRLKEKFEVL